MILVNDTLPNDFYKKDFNIRSVSASENVDSQEDYVEFLKRLECLNRLWLENVSFDRFYDRLPELDQLTVSSVTKNLTPITNYDFLFKLNGLKHFTTDRDSPEFYNLIFALFGHLKRLATVSFDFDEDIFTITSSPGNKKYGFSRETRDTKNEKAETIFERHEMDADDLVRFLKAYKSA